MAQKKYVQAATIATGVAMCLALAVPAFADTNSTQAGATANVAWGGKGMMMGGRMGGGFMMGHNGVFGTVTAISGDTITLTSKAFAGRGGSATSTSASTTYTVDATNATVTKAGAASTVSAIAVGDTIVVQGTVSGTSVTATKINDGIMGGMQRAPGVFGTVASISGDTLTVTQKMMVGPNSTTGTTTTYTVDATNATVMKNGAASTVSAIAVGDTVMVQGTISGTSVTATKINDGVVPRAGGAGAGTPNPIITGNGQPVIAGSVTAISGDTLTITNKSNVTYTVDATSATIEKGNAASTVSAIAVGDSVVIQGTVNGTSVTASSVLDQGTAPAAGSGNGGAPAHRGILSSIGSFFSKLFGF